MGHELHGNLSGQRLVRQPIPGGICTALPASVHSQCIDFLLSRLVSRHVRRLQSIENARPVDCDRGKLLVSLPTLIFDNLEVVRVAS